MQKLAQLKHQFDCIVCGGGIGGVCAALAAARKGLKTALINDRSVLGGNASSEIRVHIGGASEHGYHNDARETGLIEEIRLNIAAKDPFNEYIWIDTVLFSMCKTEPNLNLYLNTNIFDLQMNGNSIEKVIGVQAGSELIHEFHAPLFIDGTGDGTIGYLAGAEYRRGREARSEFNEQFAPEKPDDHCLGASILFQARDMGRPIPYNPPEWAVKMNKELLQNRMGYKKSNNHAKYWHDDSAGWWWVELGNTITNNESNKMELQAIVYGLWDWIKNKDPTTMELAKNYEITWIGQVPGKRESRRLMGDYLLHESDLINMKIFEDQIAIGGWSIDLHPPGGFYSNEAGSKHLHMDLPYSIPYRCIYSKNVQNLLIASRCISASHVAHGSTRLIATLGCIGQAAGTAAFLCKKYNCTPQDIGSHHITSLQQELLKDDQTLIKVKNNDPADLARSAKCSSNSEYPCEFGNPTKYIPLMFPMAQRFYISPIDFQSHPDTPQIALYLQNESNNEQKVFGGIRLDEDRYEFTATTDLVNFSIIVPPKSKGWFLCVFDSKKMNELAPILRKGGHFWLYLEDNEVIAWGKNEECHWNGFRFGYFNELTEKWQTVRINGSPFFDHQIGFYGVFCFKITGVGSPFPAHAILNGEIHPDGAPNVWISAPFRPHPLTDPAIIAAQQSIQEINTEISPEIYICFEEIKTISEIWLTMDTELNNSFPHASYSAERIKDWPIGGKAPKCIRNMDIFTEDDQQVRLKIGEIRENYQRRVKIHLSAPIHTKKMIFVPLANWGFHCFNLYEIRLY
jgi:hypothetical protein